METLNKQRGVALPIALIILVVLLFSGIYLMRASNNATLMSSNLAYERDISRRADFGLSAAYDWLNTTAVANNGANKGLLDSDQPANYRDAAFWVNSHTVNDPSGNPVEYVIHRMCQYGALAPPVPYNGAFGGIPQQCVLTQSVNNPGGTVLGSSLSADADVYTQLPQIHYVITARVPGVKGASVINQLVVMIGA
jgi:Tfp pilus assembly protein PilX